MPLFYSPPNLQKVLLAVLLKQTMFCKGVTPECLGCRSAALILSVMVLLVLGWYCAMKGERGF